MIIEVEGRRVEVDDGFAKLSPERQAAEVDAIASQLRLARGRDSDSGPLGQINQGIAETIGGLVDFINPLDNLGVTGSAQTALERGIDAIGAARAREPAQGIGQNVFRGIGNAAGAVVPAGAALRALSTAPGLLGAASAAASRGINSVPGLLAELVGGGGAGAGGEFAEESFGPNARLAGELIGGLGAPLAAVGAGAGLAAAGRGVQRLPLGSAVGNAVRTTGEALNRTILPFAGTGARVAAARRLRSVAGDADLAAAELSNGSEIGLTPAQQSGDPGLASLERRAAQSDPRLARELSERAASSQARVREEVEALGRGGEVRNTTEFLEARRAAFEKRLQQRVQEARARAEERIAALEPQRQPAENSVIVREEIDAAFRGAKRQEQALFARVPGEREISTDAMKSRFQALVEGTTEVTRDDIPARASRFLSRESNSGFGERTTVDEVLDLVSKLREDARNALSGETQNRRLASRANELAEGLLDDLQASPQLLPNEKAAIIEARAFSRALNETFRQGTVNDVRTRSRTGRGRVAPELTLERAFGTGGERAGVAARDIRAAAPAADPAMEDFTRGLLTDRTIRLGNFSDTAAEQFQRRNRGLLGEFPQVADDLAAARTANRAAQETESRVNDIVARLNDKRRSVTSAFISATPGSELASAVLRARDPVRAARQIRNAAAKDSTGRALDGFRAAFVDDLIERSVATGLDANNQPVISGSRLTALLADNRIRGAMAQVFEPDEMRRLDRVAKEALKLERALATPSATSVINDAPNAIINIVARVAGAKAGARAAGSGNAGVSLQAAQIGSGRAKRLIASLTNDRAERLLFDAIQDGELMRDLLRNTGTVAGDRAAARRIAAWIAGTGAVVAEGDGQ